MDKIEWEGTDADLEISLFEYGLICRPNPVFGDPNDWLCLYQVTEDAFNVGHYDEQSINKLLNGDEWAYDSDIKSFLSFVGEETVEEFLKVPFVHKLSSLLNYWGCFNIFGSSFLPMDTEETKEYLNNKVFSFLGEVA
jgi:hypothetical protein